MDHTLKLIPHSGKNLVTGEIQYFHQWRVILCDGDSERAVGILGWGEDDKILFTSPVDPPTTQWIKDEVLRQGQESKESVSYPDIPADLIENSVGELDEFDEEELTG